MECPRSPIDENTYEQGDALKAEIEAFLHAIDERRACGGDGARTGCSRSAPQ